MTEEERENLKITRKLLSASVAFIDWLFRETPDGGRYIFDQHELSSFLNAIRDEKARSIEETLRYQEIEFALKESESRYLVANCFRRSDSRRREWTWTIYELSDNFQTLD